MIYLFFVIRRESLPPIYSVIKLYYNPLRVFLHNILVFLSVASSPEKSLFPPDASVPGEPTTP
jgi:hypothetical protein